ncbi:MAG: hypothetical protein WA183_03605 [Chthoniobacterales bacterium]
MKTLCLLALVLLLALPRGVTKDRHCMFRLHAEANPCDTAIFAASVRAQFSGKDIAIERMPRVSERDVVAFILIRLGMEPTVHCFNSMTTAGLPSTP